MLPAAVQRMLECSKEYYYPRGKCGILFIFVFVLFPRDFFTPHTAAAVKNSERIGEESYQDNSFYRIGMALFASILETGYDDRLECLGPICAASSFCIPRACAAYAEPCLPVDQLAQQVYGRVIPTIGMTLVIFLFICAEILSRQRLYLDPRWFLCDVYYWRWRLPVARRRTLIMWVWRYGKAPTTTSAARINVR